MFRGDSHLLDEKIGFKQLLRGITLSWIYKFIDTALHVGTNNKAYYLKHGLKENQLVFAPHAIDNERFHDNKEKAFELHSRKYRDKLGLKENDIVLAFIGKLQSKKNPELLLNAFSLHFRENVHLLYIGNGELEQNLKMKAKQSTNIHFLDFQNQSLMPLVYRIADILILPSQENETWAEKLSMKPLPAVIP